MIKRFKKIFLISICLIFAFNYCCFADDNVEDVTEDDYNISNEAIEVSADITEEPETYSKHIICIERTTGEVIFEKDAYSKTAMASTTKIMTAVIALENCDLSQNVEISSKAANTGGSTLGITAGTTMNMETLMYGLMLRSGNDCAVAIAEHIGGSVESFANLMNKKAEELGLVNTHFVTPHGLDDDKHYTTAYDLAVLTNYALKIEKFREIVGVKETSIMVGNYSRTITNTNELLGNIEGVYGVKTGFTGNAGRCLVTACKRNNLDIIIVVLGADTKKIRGLDTKVVINYVYNNFEMVDTYQKIKSAFDNFKKMQTIIVNKSLDIPEIGFKDNYTYIYPINKNDISNLQTSIYTVNRINSETEINTKLGVLTLKYNDRILYSLDIVLKNRLKRTTWQDYLKIFISNYKNYFDLYV